MKLQVEASTIMSILVEGLRRRGIVGKTAQNIQIEDFTDRSQTITYDVPAPKARVGRPRKNASTPVTE